jgi:hypothetical protein
VAGTSTSKNEKRRFHLAPGVNERIISNALIEHYKRRIPRLSEFREDHRLSGNYPENGVLSGLATIHSELGKGRRKSVDEMCAKQSRQ